MNLDNVVLVRAMGHLPLNGELIPSCEGERLELEKSSDFQHYILRLIKMDLSNKLGRPLNIFHDSPDEVLVNKMLEEYRVLTGAYYTSTLSFSLNGLVPDDNTCKFSELPVAVIDPIKNHTDADFVNIHEIDSTIKGKRKVSPEAILVINKNVFESLNDEVKNNLTSNFKQVKMFEGSLNEAVHNTLLENNYPSLPLKEKKEAQQCIGECHERDSMLEFEDSFAKSVGASRAPLFNLYTGGYFSDEIDQAAHDKISQDFYKNLDVIEYYKKQLYTFMLAKAESLGIEVSDEEKFYLFSSYPEGIDAMERITKELFTKYGGLENFKQFIKEYNAYAIANYITNEEIIALKSETRK